MAFITPTWPTLWLPTHMEAHTQTWMCGRGARRGPRRNEHREAGCRGKNSRLKAAALALHSHCTSRCARAAPLAALVLPFVVESPYWLLQRGKHASAQRVLDLMLALNQLSFRSGSARVSSLRASAAPSRVPRAQLPSDRCASLIPPPSPPP